MLDFTSALYLGLWHSSRSLRPWAQLTSGRPAALNSLPGARPLAQRLAALQGCEAATLGPSTLHLLLDLFQLLTDRGGTVYLDEESYPISRWAVERAVGRGARSRVFAHQNVAALATALRRDRPHRGRPIAAVDGLCPDCGRPAPLPAYLALLRPVGGLLVVDDTQAIGLLGNHPSATTPCGRGGGGSLRWHGLAAPDVVMVSSLAKALGAPIAVLSAAGPFVAHFEARSETRVHCSPPSRAALRAAERALDLNQAHGDELRLRLTQAVRRFRRGLRKAGIQMSGHTCFPVQSLVLPTARNPFVVYNRLLSLGVRPLLRGDHAGVARVTFCLTAAHGPEAIDRTVAAVAAAVECPAPAQSARGAA